MSTSALSPRLDTLLNTFVGALQGTLSVLLILLAGYFTARRGHLDHPTVRRLSKLCTTLFLPCLIVEQTGPQLTAARLRAVWIVPLWGLASTLLAHAVGWAGRRALPPGRLPHWTVAASGRPNSNALPLLLLQSLEGAGVLDALARPGEAPRAALGRAKSLVLLNAIVQQTFTFQVTPGIMARDGRQAQDDEEEEEEEEEESRDALRPGPGRLTAVVQDQERVGLLDDHDCDSYDSEQRRAGAGYRHALDDIVDRPDVHWPERLRPLERPLKKVWSSTSPPLIGAVVALIIGIIPPLNRQILSKDGAFYTSVTQAVANLGELFVVLQTFTVGAELAIVPSTKPGALATAWVLLVRFLVMPAVALLFVFLTAGRGFYVDDRLVWFLLVLIPAGPSAMLLVSVAELVDASQGAVAGYLTIAYMVSPLMAVVCALGLEVVSIAARRVPGV
ncbi:auxin efflux carrier [Trametes meyenii]|nr:auxin efflux carrier [Trametes meyenii]